MDNKLEVNVGFVLRKFKNENENVMKLLRYELLVHTVWDTV